MKDFALLPTCFPVLLALGFSSWTLLSAGCSSGCPPGPDYVYAHPRVLDLGCVELNTTGKGHIRFYVSASCRRTLSLEIISTSGDWNGTHTVEGAVSPDMTDGTHYCSVVFTPTSPGCHTGELEVVVHGIAWVNPIPVHAFVPPPDLHCESFRGSAACGFEDVWWKP